MKKFIVFIYGILSYVMFLGVFLYAVCFIGNIYITNSLDAMPQLPFSHALMINIGLISLFAIQHSGMARQGFKKWIIKFIPSSAERVTYVFISNIALVVILYFWQPMGGVLWNTDNEILKNLLLTLYMFGWMVLLASSFLIDHFHLFGLKQVWYDLTNKKMTYSKFMIPSLYKRVRHPLYVGWVIVVWASPIMTVAHLVFALLCTLYIIVGIKFEEKDLEAEFGDEYRAYKKQVPMIIPSIRAKEFKHDQLINNK